MQLKGSKYRISAVNTELIRLLGIDVFSKIYDIQKYTHTAVLEGEKKEKILKSLNIKGGWNLFLEGAHSKIYEKEGALIQEGAYSNKGA